MNISDFSIAFFKKLEAHQIPYAVCGNYEELPYATEHDIDIWSPNPQAIKSILFDVAQATGYRCFLMSLTANGFNSIFYGEGRKEPWLKVDVMTELSLFSTVPIVKAEVIAKNLVQHRGIKVVSHELEVIMNFSYALLARGFIKEKYRQATQTLLMSGEKETFCEHLRLLLGKEDSNQIMEWIREEQWNELESASPHLRKKLVMHFLWRDASAAFLRLIRLAINHLQRAFHKTGYYLAFVGIDGAGKTTLLEALRKDFEFVLKKEKVHVGYWRPFLFPELKALNPFANETKFTNKIDLGEGKNQGLSEDRSLMQHKNQKVRNPFKIFYYHLKFLYYWTDFLIGPLAKFWGQWSRGGVAFFDRSYIDMQIMPERFDFRVSQRFMQMMRSFIPQPDATFLLWAPPDVIHTRKIEFEIEAIQKQIDQYMRYKSHCHQFIDVDTSAPLAEVKEKVIGAIHLTKVNTICCVLSVCAL